MATKLSNFLNLPFLENLANITSDELILTKFKLLQVTSYTNIHKYIIYVNVYMFLFIYLHVYKHMYVNIRMTVSLKWCTNINWHGTEKFVPLAIHMYVTHPLKVKTKGKL